MESPGCPSGPGKRKGSPSLELRNRGARQPSAGGGELDDNPASLMQEACGVGDLHRSSVKSRKPLSS